MVPNWNEKINKYVPHIDVSQNFKNFYLNLMIIVSFLGIVPLARICYIVYKTSECSHLSSGIYIFQVLIYILWLLYGLIIKNIVIMISSSVTIVMSLFLVYSIKKQNKKI